MNIVEVKSALEGKMLEVLMLLEKKLSRSLPVPTIELRKLGRCAGRANSALCKIQINQDFCFNGHWRDTLDVTLPHEVAHIIADLIYMTDYHDKGIPFTYRPHGAVWKWVMKLIGLPPKVSHDYDLTGVSVRHRKPVERPYKYQCSCRIHFLSKVKHKRVQNDEYALFRCRVCKGGLTYIGMVDKD